MAQHRRRRDRTSSGSGMRRVREAARDPASVRGAAGLTISLDDDPARADDRLNDLWQRYYHQPAAATRRRQACYACPSPGLADWSRTYANAGAIHLVTRFAGDHARHLARVAKLLPL